jgi:cytochrome c-type biogenesis protein CcsB
MQSLNESTAGKMTVPDEALTALHNFQIAYGKNLIPGEFKVRLEILNNRLNLFDRLGSAYGLAGFILLILLFMTIFIPRLNLRPYTKAFVWIIGLFFIIHFLGLIARWIISGHAPWSNGYESLIYIAFATVLAGLILSHKSTITLSVTAILAWLILFVAHLNWMDPQITNLVPVLKSYWLLIHVAVITASYGFLAMGAVMAFLNLILMIAQTKGNHIRTHQIITEFSLVIEMTLIIGLYLLTIGTFLGGVWANESWGRYWGWDPKETWALVSVLIYAFVAHMRLVPGLKGNYLFNLMSLLAFSSIIMTYFGVNYYLSGLHSYAKGDPLPVPSFVYYALAIIGLVALLAWENQRRMKLLEVDAPEQGLISSGTKFRKPNSTITVVDHVDDL